LLGHRRWLASGPEEIYIGGGPQIVLALEAMKLNHQAADQ